MNTRACIVACIGLWWLAACGGDADEPAPKPSVPVPFATVGDHLGIWDDGDYRPLFIQGVNLGVAVPGTLAGELAASREQYDRWLNQLGALGINAIRSYTLHYPRFYDALAHYNRQHAGKPIYLLAGVWLDEENTTGDFFDMTDGFDASIRENIDCAHGKCTIAERRGRAFGEYRTDVSAWIIGWIIGREIAPDEIRSTNLAHPEHTEYAGVAVSLPQGTPIEAWLVERLDHLVLYERERYGVERPFSISSWPTLDPLHHPTESPNRSMEDVEALDLENIDTRDAPGGFFASYHAYPYYPNFMKEDPEYATARDEQGPNAYFGYLRDLKRHYATHPLLIAEFGVPTSWGNAHFGAAGMNHGGEDEREQGAYAARMLANMRDANCAGGALFAWIDEWWKRTWIVDELALPRDRYRLWHNVASPEQNFGLIAFDLGAPDFKRWRATSGNGRITEVAADVDAEFFHVRLKLNAPVTAGEELTIAFDTYGDDVGESRLPDGSSAARRNEFALVYRAPDEAQLYVTQAYDLFGIWHGTSDESQLFHSIASDGAPWAKVRWRNNERRDTDLEEPNTIDEVGKLIVGTLDDAVSSRVGLIVDGSTLHVRLPWTLLQFADPSTRSVLADDRSTKPRETLISDGIALEVDLAGERLTTGRLRWDTWDEAPKTSERLKASAEILANALREMQ
jgi:hypothetical protein